MTLVKTAGKKKKQKKPTMMHVGVFFNNSWILTFTSISPKAAASHDK